MKPNIMEMSAPFSNIRTYVEKHDAMGILPKNILNKQIYFLLLFWFSYLIYMINMINLLSFVRKTLEKKYINFA